MGEIIQAVVETAEYSLTIDATKGARITALTDKRLGLDITRHDETGLGGLLEDRPYFSNSHYAGRVAEQGPERIAVTFSVRNDDNVALTKSLTFAEGRPYFEVSYEISNGSQLPFRLWIRNFATPGGGELAEADRVFLRHNGRLLDLSFPNGYYAHPDNPWMCYLDTERLTGFWVRCEDGLLDQFYFWSESRLTPTFEWVYKPVPAGQSTVTSLRFGLANEVRRAEDITAEGEVLEAASPPPGLPAEPPLAPVPDWKPAEELYAPSPQERERGFIATVSGSRPPKVRLESLEVDLGLDERDAIPLEAFALAEEARIVATVSGELAEHCTLRVEDGFWLRDGREMTVVRGRYGRLWLTVNSTGLPPGHYTGVLTLSSGTGTPLELPLSARVWGVRLPEKPNFGIQMYAFLPTLSDYNLDDMAKRKLVTYLNNLEELRVDNCDWAVAGHHPAMRVTVKGTGELLTEWGKAHPNTPIAELPDIEFRYFDPWFEESVKRNMTRFLIHVPAVHDWRSAAIVTAALGREEDPNSDLGRAVMAWYYRQLRRYAEEKGFTSFWAKIDDEIPQEHIPVWIQEAARLRALGYKTFTTITGNIARSAKLLQDMNPYCDAWQVALCLSREFMELTRMSASFEQRLEVCDLAFGPYDNGGAENTWATLRPFFADPRPLQDRVDEVQVFANGVPLAMRDGSGWGNKDRGVAMVWGGHLYVCLPDGSDPNKAKIQVAYRVRTMREGGVPAVQLQPGAEVWYYGGGNYKMAYEAARAYPWRMCAYRMDGYGFWTYLWWNGEDILAKLDPQSMTLTLSPAWEGLRDGNEDAAYFREAQAMLTAGGNTTALDKLFSVFAGDQAPLKMGEVRREVYAWTDFLDPTYAAYNTAKRTVLELLATR